jgi:Zn-dependent protease with chaperone function
VGQGLLDALAPAERRVVLAHERAHLTHHHHRYLQIAETMAAAFPFLAPIAGQVRYVTERWADEVAARTVGDRELVACTIMKAALSATPDALLPSAAGGHVTARVAALLDQRPTTRHRLWAGRASLASVAVTLAAASVQVHHLGVYISHASHGHL